MKQKNLILLVVFTLIACSNNSVPPDSVKNNEYVETYDYYHLKYFNMHYKSLQDRINAPSEKEMLNSTKSSYIEVSVFEKNFNEYFQSVKDKIKNQDLISDYQELSELIKNFKESLEFEIKTMAPIGY